MPAAACPLFLSLFLFFLFSPLVYGPSDLEALTAFGNVVSMDDYDVKVNEWSYENTDYTNSIIGGQDKNNANAYVYNNQVTVEIHEEGHRIAGAGGYIWHLGIGVTGGLARNGNAYDNYVTIINASNINGIVCGGYSVSGNATENSISIGGGTYGGGSISGVYGGYSGSGDAINNIVTISNDYGTLDFTTYTAHLYGDGNLNGGGGGGDYFTGNTLNLNCNTIIPTAGNFEIINFGNISTANITKLLHSTFIHSFIPLDTVL